MRHNMLPKMRDWTISLLRRSERYTKTDMLYLVRGGSWLTLGQVIATITVFGTAIAFAHLVPKDIYGTYKYALAVVGILSITTLPGVNTYMAQAIARGAEGTFMAGVRARILWGLFGSAGAGIAAFYYLWNGNVQLAAALAVAALFIPFVETLGLYNTYLQSTRRFKESIQYFAVVQLGSAIVLIGTMFFTTNILILLLAYFLPPTILRYHFLRHTLERFTPNTVQDTRAIHYGTHLSIIGILGQIVIYIDTILLFHFLGPIQVAIYSFALAPADQMRALFTKNLPSLALPRMAKRTYAEIDSVIRSRLLALTLSAAGIALLYAIAAPSIFSILFPQYTDSIVISQALAALLVLLLPSSFLGTALQAKLHTIPHPWLYWAVVPDAIHILALLVFLPTIGIWGIVASKVLDALFTLIVSAIQWRTLRHRSDALDHGVPVA